MTKYYMLGTLLFLSISFSNAEVVDTQVESIKLANISMEKQLQESKSLLYQGKISLSQYQELEMQAKKMNGYYQKVSPLMTKSSAAEEFRPENSSCTAVDVSGWIECKNKMSNGAIKKIIIEKDINCSKADDCSLSVSDKNDLTITSNNNVKIVRNSGFGRALIQFTNVKNGEISNVNFIEPINNPIQLSKGAQEVNSECKDYNYACDSLIKIDKSSNVSVKNVKIINGKLFGLSLYDNESILVEDSEISNSWWFGIWGGANKKLIIKKTKFLNNRSNGALLDFKNAVEVKIVDSLFSGNHHATAFHVCEGGGAPCPGGQIDFVNHVQNLTVENNVFENGKMSGEFPEDINHNWVSAIEFEPHAQNIQNVVIKNNIIKNNTGSSFFVNAPSSGKEASFIADIVFADNQVCNNGTKYNFPNGASWGKQVKIFNSRDVCAEDSSGVISANSCSISSRGDVCSIDVKWEASTDSVCMWSGDTLWACEGKSVTKKYPYVGINPVNLILRAGKTVDSPELARMVVVAQLASVKNPFIKSFGAGCNDGNCGWLIGDYFRAGMTVDIRATGSGEMLRGGIETNFEQEKGVLTFAIPKDLQEKFKEDGFDVYVVDAKNGVWSNPIFLKK